MGTLILSEPRTRGAHTTGREQTVFVILGLVALFMFVFVVGTVHLFTGGRMSGAILNGIATHYSREAIEARELRDLRDAQRR
jgi:hypothetical protein